MKLIHVGAALAAGLAVASCGSSRAKSPSDSGGGMLVRVMLQDSSFADAKAVLVTFTEMSVLQASGAFRGVPFADAATSRTCDLKKLEGAPDLLGFGPLAAGQYTELRLTVSSTVLYFDNPSAGPACAPAIAAPDGATATATVQSGTLTLSYQFEAPANANGMTTLILDFDGDKSISKLRNGSYMMKPVIAARGGGLSYSRER